MSIYTYEITTAISLALGLDPIETIEVSDQHLHEMLKTATHKNIPFRFSHKKHLSEEERKSMTKPANDKKRGMKESARSKCIKSFSQKKRWENMSEEQRKEMGIKSKNGISEEGKKRQTKNANLSFSPARQKGVKQPLTICPHCSKIGGRAIMGRYHFDRCKEKAS